MAQAADADAMPAAAESPKSAVRIVPASPGSRGTKPAPPLAARVAELLIVDRPEQEHTAEPGETKHTFTFHVSNASAADAIVVEEVRTSCGCSVPSLPAKPWRLSPGASGDVTITVDFAGKTGVLVKTATIETSRGIRPLTVKLTIPGARFAAEDSAMRTRNLELASSDRQAVFKGDCVRCHAQPAAGLRGEALYFGACGVCHEAEHRASMVPALRDVAQRTTRDDWITIIAQGKPGTLMPAFAEAAGGPLSAEQIESLADYLLRAFPGAPERAAPVAAPKR